MIYVFLANGFEEMEALTPVDCLRRAGYSVSLVGVGGAAIRGAHGIVVGTDLTDDRITLDDALEMVVLPGGMPGTLNLEASSFVRDAVRYCAAHDRFLAAICAAPTILGHLGLLDGRRATCYAGFEQQLGEAQFTGDAVTVDGRIITGRSAGVATAFSLMLVEQLKGTAAAQKLSEALMCEP